MTGPVAIIEKGCRSALACSCDKCGCKLNLDERLPTPWALVDMDARSLGLRAITRCDYLFVAEEGSGCWVVPIELTRGRNKKAAEVQKQLQRGADLADSHLRQSTEVKLRPVLAARGIKKGERKPMKKVRITFRGQSKPIKPISCGDSLSRALK